MTHSGGGNVKLVLLAVAALLLSGCGLQRQTVRINALAIRIASASGPTIAIGSLIDARQPATKIKLSRAEQASNVGGLGNGGHGVAVQLEDGTVRDAMQRIVTAALQNAGFDVTDSAPAGSRVDVRISKFQVLIPFQFWRTAFYNPRMLADIEAEITITTPGGVQNFDVKGHGYNVYQRVIAENWQIALGKAVSDFEKNLRERVADPMEGR